MKPRELEDLGIPRHLKREAMGAISKASKAGMGHREIRIAMADVAANPDSYVEDPNFGELATALIEAGKKKDAALGYEPRKEPAPYRRWGSDDDPQAVRQMEAACRLPVAVAGGLMPDAHVGYGLPIGGVLAVRNAVIPYAVGVDIACRMKMTVLDMPVETLESGAERLRKAIEKETRFGVGAIFEKRREHPVMDEDWSVSQVTSRLKSKAWDQLGTSGSGNHFVEFGVLTVEKDGLGIPPGKYLALLSHSGSRGTGSEVANYYSRLAMDTRRDLPKDLKHLAWLDLDSEAGQEYWAAMQLMGRYAAANHELIHRHVARNLGAQVILDVENHHNFAWKETHFGEDVVVHRKGATPAAAGVLGIIPGSMASPAFVVRGRGEPHSLNSASHGAGRKMSRQEAKRRFRWSDLETLLKERGVTLISAGLDEVPMAYKDIEEVMAAQGDLVETLARFDPKLVKMSGGDERPED
ncbi:MAG: RtcB family protein [Planctomycetota bacterium]|nr:RtcB family protein [Planctomycetota bacterium]